MVYAIFFVAGFLIALQIAEWVFEESGPLAHKWIGASVGKPVTPSEKEVAIPAEALDITSATSP